MKRISEAEISKLRLKGTEITTKDGRPLKVVKPKMDAPPAVVPEKKGPDPVLVMAAASEKIVRAIKEIRLDVPAAEKRRPREWRLEVDRDNMGYIETIRAKEVEG